MRRAIPLHRVYQNAHDNPSRETRDRLTRVRALRAEAVPLEGERADISRVIDRADCVVLYTLCVRNHYYFVRAGRLRDCADYDLGCGVAIRLSNRLR